MTTTKLIDVTSAAAQQLEKVLAEQGEESSLLRIMVMPGQHGGYQYMLGVEQEAKADDIVIEAENISVIVDGESAPLVDGAQIDYVDGLMRSGFVISKPQHGRRGRRLRLRRRWRRMRRRWRRGLCLRRWRWRLRRRPLDPADTPSR